MRRRAPDRGAPVLTDSEFQAIVADQSKEIVGDLVWIPDRDRKAAVGFRVPVLSTPDYPLTLAAYYNPGAPRLSYTLIHRPAGRIYGLDLGVGHRNPDFRRVGRTHKHTWSEEHRDRRAYEPADITESWRDPVAVWLQFCGEARLTHIGEMQRPFVQLRMDL